MKTLSYGEQTDLFYCWELHIIRLPGKNTLAAVNAYFEQAGEVGLTKTHGRSSVATLNKMMEYPGFLPMVMDHGALYQAAHCHEVNRDLCHAAGFPDYGLPVEFLEADMKKAGII